MGAGEALRRVLECVASGILLPGMAMLLDGTAQYSTVQYGTVQYLMVQ